MRFWHVRMIKDDILSSHPGWVVKVPLDFPMEDQAEEACRIVQQKVHPDTEPEGEYAGYELTADILEWSAGVVAELY